jgi:sugar fermentation stimulation protein A
MAPLLTVEDDLVTGTVVDRPNRFVVRVRFDTSLERVFLGDPGFRQLCLKMTVL